MIISRMFSKKESDKKKSGALGASLGIAGIGTGGSFLYKHIADKKTNRKYDDFVSKTEENHGLKKAERELQLRDNIAAERKSAFNNYKSDLDWIEKRSEWKKRDNIFNPAEHELEKAAAEKKYKSALKEGEESLRKNAQEFQERADQNLKKNIENLNKGRRLDLKINKRHRNLALIGTGLAAAGTYGILKHRENKRKKDTK